jgi:mRNA interferase HicA
MKQRDLIKKFTDAGWKFSRHGARHEIYVKDGKEEQIPRRREINEKLAKHLIDKWGL